jgi:hypothetical protein
MSADELLPETEADQGAGGRAAVPVGAALGREFDVLCEFLANSLVVQTDETSWSINSVWAFLSEKVRVVLFGVHKHGAMLLEILDPTTFAGIVVSDDAAVYAKFTRSQKCWAHPPRRAITLTLMEPTNAKYRRLADRLPEIYPTACRVQREVSGRIPKGTEVFYFNVKDEAGCLVSSDFVEVARKD